MVVVAAAVDFVRLSQILLGVLQQFVHAFELAGFILFISRQFRLVIQALALALGVDATAQL